MLTFKKGQTCKIYHLSLIYVKMGIWVKKEWMQNNWNRWSCVVKFS